ncbi:carboxypeptidase-like regulatory domain-containing protein, partial [Tannerella forsythia]|uniref:carboxypeptidase-like regulatory domain-containing protein n=1 Tax=Tannerella forsythia TaxID=28112 RepID=UPI0028F14079
MDRTYKILLILSLILGVMQPVQAQHILKGVVYDEAGTGVFSTTLRVLTEDSVFVSGGITDGNGDFEIKNIKAGKYILAVSNIGYAGQFIAFEMPGSDYTLPTVVLKTDVVALGEVTVRGSTFIRKKDHLLVIPDKQQIKHAFSGYDLLYNLMIPGLDVNRKDKKVTATTGEATLYINGVKADFRDVQNLRPKDIEKVEYYTLPTGKYTGDAASINYITKTYTTGGYVNMEAEQKIGYLGGNYDAAAKLSHKQTNYSFYGGYSTTGYGGIKKEKNEALFLSDYTVNRNRETGYANYRSNYKYIHFQVSNSTKKRNLLSWFSLNRSATPQNDRDERLNYTGHDERSVMSSEKSESSSLKPTAYLRGDFNLSEKHLLKSECVTWYTRNTYERTYTEDQRRSSTSVNENLYSFVMTNRYTFRPDTSNTYLVHLNHYHDRSFMEYSGDYESKQHLLNGQTIFRINYIREFGKKATLYVDPGISLMNYRLQNERMKYVWT